MSRKPDFIVGNPDAPYMHRWWMIPRNADTLFITGPRIREWGFHCPKGWVHWKKFCAVDQPGQIGSGCGED